MGLDSVELIVDVETHFSISIPNREAEKAATVGKLVDCVSVILGVKGYDFTLRENVFAIIKSEILKLRPDSPDFSIQTHVVDTIDIADAELITDLESGLGLQFIGLTPKKKDSFWNRVSNWLSTDHLILEKTSWKKYTDIILSANLENAVTPFGYRSKYEIYLAIMKITVEKTGVDFDEIGIEKSFTNDLGID